MKDLTGKNWWRPPTFGWKYLNYFLIVIGTIVGFAVWFMPSRWADPKIAEGFHRQIALEQAVKARKAEEARIAQEQEELGLVYIEPGTNPFLPPQKNAPAGKGATTGSEPAKNK